MSAVIDYMRSLVGEFQSHQIRATSDPRSINPPCVLLVPPTYNRDTFNGVTAEFQALALVPGPGNLDAFAALDALVADVVTKVLPDTARISPIEYTPDNGPTYPAYQLEWQASLDWP